METSRLLLKNTTLNLVGYLYLLLASFISVPLLVRGLGGELFSQYLLLSAVPPIMSIFDLGVSQAVIRALSQQSGRENLRIRQTSYFFYLVNAVVLGIITYGLVTLIGKSPVFEGAQLPPQVLVYLAGSVSLNQLTTHFLSLAQARHRFDIFNLKTFFVGTGNTLVAGFIAIRGGGLLPIFLALFLSYLLTFVLVVTFLDKCKSFLEKPQLDLPSLKALLVYGLRTFIGRVAGQLELHAGKYTLANLSSLAVSAFTIPQSLMYKAAGAISQCALALFPLSSSLADPTKREKLRRLYYRLQLGILALSLLGVLLAHLIGRQFLALWLGDSSLIEVAYPVLRLLSYFFILLSLTPVASTIVDSLGYPHYTSFSAVLTAILNTVLLLALTPRYGAIGAAYAILLASLVTTPLFLLVTERVLQSNKLKY